MSCTKRLKENEIFVSDNFSLVVIPSYRDFPGYTDNISGPTGIIVWAHRGLVHTIYGDSSKQAFLVPVDYCINALVTSAWDIHEK